MNEPPARLVLFDGVCGLCDRSVQFLLDRDPEARFVFAPLQGPTAAEVRERHPELPHDLDSIIYVETRGGGADGERISYRSRAVLRICAELPMPWRLLSIFRIVPSFLMDVAYRLVASVRYRVWGKRDACRVPTPDERARFLD